MFLTFLLGTSQQSEFAPDRKHFLNNKFCYWVITRLIKLYMNLLSEWGESSKTVNLPQKIELQIPIDDLNQWSRRKWLVKRQMEKKTKSKKQTLTLQQLNRNLCYMQFITHEVMSRFLCRPVSASYFRFSSLLTIFTVYDFLGMQRKSHADLKNRLQYTQTHTESKWWRHYKHDNNSGGLGRHSTASNKTSS